MTTTKFDKAVGRYVHLTIDDVEYRVYYEESGSGIPLLLQHTAGCDGRQYRHLLEDEEITSHFRVITWDLPYHGRSLPPLSVRWWEQEYNLTQDFFMKFVVALAEALDCEDAVYMGSSMGGNLAPDLALHYPGVFRAVIALEAALHSPGFYLDYWFHPEISNDSKPAAMYALTSPTAPRSAAGKRPGSTARGPRRSSRVISTTTASSTIFGKRHRTSIRRRPPCTSSTANTTSRRDRRRPRNSARGSRVRRSFRWRDSDTSR